MTSPEGDFSDSSEESNKRGTKENHFNYKYKTPGNKIDEAKVGLIKEHIKRFPKYSSYYSRQKAPNKKYLAGNLNLKKMYQLYKEFCEEKETEPARKTFYRYVFNTCFNLSFHSPYTDTRATCDKLQNTIDHRLLDEKHGALVEKELHLRKAQIAQKQVVDARNLVAKDARHVAVCFVLQEMLPTPVLTCSQAYYSQQLWTYNLCVHDLGSGKAFMFMWHEDQASRGCQEIMSCLLKFINSLPPTITHLTAFSDNAGGQNKNQHRVKFWLYIVNNTHIQIFDRKFLLCGHSFNDCDRNFGIIERSRKIPHGYLCNRQGVKTF
ncbi:uncharacterized protein LOC124594055 [Schistocerca americana]|uniref:uncharacterized protein LOC124594055 n=1 Tax=Schistocerca americana TaxID=7009 RepID=UPI001F4FCF57|nr:uncharacterized protein LOC124594055 [Schistocerca americana]